MRAARQHPVVTALAVAALLVASAVACSGDGGTDQAGGAGDPGTSAPATPSSGAGPEAAVRLAAINVLHGLSCPEESDFCDAPGRIELLWRQLEEAGCPDLVGLTEIGPRQGGLVPAMLPELCDGRYQLVWDPVAQAQEFDRQMILTTLPVLEDGYVDLAAFPWGAHWALVDSAIGPLVFSTTHFASSVNNPPCDAEICPPACEAGLEAGSCNAIELVDALDAIGDDGTVRVISGDLNQPADHPRIRIITDAGYVDAWTLAGLPECDPATGEGCTCCVDDGSEWPNGGLRSPAAGHDERIDFILVEGSATCQPESVDGSTARLAGAPADPPHRDLFWPSDHDGVVTTIRCAGT